jgi:hypothetical protein
MLSMRDLIAWINGEAATLDKTCLSDSIRNSLSPAQRRVLAEDGAASDADRSANWRDRRACLGAAAAPRWRVRRCSVAAAVAPSSLRARRPARLVWLGEGGAPARAGVAPAEPARVSPREPPAASPVEPDPIAASRKARLPRPGASDRCESSWLWFAKSRRSRKSCLRKGFASPVVRR